jgi:hypothetical protein
LEHGRNCGFVDLIFGSGEFRFGASNNIKTLHMNPTRLQPKLLKFYARYQNNPLTLFRTHLINRTGARGERFGAAATREEGEYPQ